MSAEPGVLIEGLEERRAESSPSAPSAPPGERRLRLKAVDRQQICLRTIDPERLIEEDHPARAIWDLLVGLDLSRFLAGIRAVEGRAGRDTRAMTCGMAITAMVLHGRDARATSPCVTHSPRSSIGGFSGKMNRFFGGRAVRPSAARPCNNVPSLVRPSSRMGAITFEKIGFANSGNLHFQ